MKKKTKRNICGVYSLIFSLFLTACHFKSTEKETRDSNSQKTTSFQSHSPSFHSSQHETFSLLDDTSWSIEKSEALKQYMYSFGREMKQWYQPYIPDVATSYDNTKKENQTLFYLNTEKKIATQLPTDLLSTHAKGNVQIKGKNRSVAWYEEHQRAEFILYGCYSDYNQINLDENHTYIFGAYHHTPFVGLLDEKNTTATTFVFVETKNEYLKNTFESIVYNQPYELENNLSDTTEERLSDNEILTLVQTYKKSDDLSFSLFPWYEDDYGSFRLVKVAIKSWQKNGGSGTANFMRIYTNGMVVDNQLAF